MDLVTCQSIAQTPASSFTRLIGVPFPETSRGPSERGATKYPFDDLGVNEAFECHNVAPATVRQAISRYYRYHGRDKRFVQRMLANGNPTLWRLK